MSLEWKPREREGAEPGEQEAECAGYSLRVSPWKHDDGQPDEWWWVVDGSSDHCRVDWESSAPDEETAKREAESALVIALVLDHERSRVTLAKALELVGPERVGQIVRALAEHGPAPDPKAFAGAKRGAR